MKQERFVYDLVEPLMVAAGRTVKLRRDYDALCQAHRSPEKNWKFSINDIRERRYWGDHQNAFDKMLSHTSTELAPWYVIAADHKWFARLATAAVLAHALAEINPQYSRPPPHALQEMAEVRAELAAEIES
jgi:Polyphosphate kinase 2 (PPK2)